MSPISPMRFLTGALAALILVLGLPREAEAASPVVVLTLDGAVTPATADYAVHGMRKAAEQGAALVVLKLDTPGGLDSSMRSIIKAILASPVPVAAFVAPDGARAASAGTFILYASHIAAMAPATNLGAATPVAIGIGDDAPKAGRDKDTREKATRDKDTREKATRDRDTKNDDKAQPSHRESMRAKQINDAAAYIRGLAQMRGRNGDWAERAVREAVSLSSAEALKLKVVDIVARDIPDLLRQVQGRTVSAAGAERTLAIAEAPVVELEPDWRTRILMVVTDPSIAVILMMIGIYGLLFEFMSPGYVAPGVLGGICLLIALYAFQLLPINYAGIALILLGIAFIVAEAFVPSFGSLGIGGIAALAFGMIILIDPDRAPGLEIPIAFVAAVTALAAILLFATVFFALKARARPIVTGREDLHGAEALVLGDFESVGWARVRGETWRVTSAVPMRDGERARVVAISGLTLTIEKA